MIVDASIVVALMLGEPTCGWIVNAIRAAGRPPLRMSWVNIAETGMVLRKVHPMAEDALEPALTGVGIVPLDLDHRTVRIAIRARALYPLNFGDCFAYAHALLLNEPLLTLDADFLKTDLADIVHPDRLRA